MNPGGAKTGGGKANKKAFAPHGTKAAASAIPPKLTLLNVRSLTRTIIRAPMDNGWDARRSLLGVIAVRSALRSPFAGRSPPRSHHRGLSEGLPRRLLLSVTGLCCLVVVAIIRRREAFVNPFPAEKFCGETAAPGWKSRAAAAPGRSPAIGSSAPLCRQSSLPSRSSTVSVRHRSSDTFSPLPPPRSASRSTAFSTAAL